MENKESSSEARQTLRKLMHGELRMISRLGFKIHGKAWAFSRLLAG